MISFEVFNIFIVVLHLCILVTLTTASEIGISSCRYLGEMEEDGKKCREDVVDIEDLPKHCTSFVYDGVICRQNYNIEFKDKTYGLERLGTLVHHDDGAHNVYLFFSHGSLNDWFNVLFTGDFLLVAQNVKTFVCENPVKGLILNQIDSPNSSVNGGDFYGKLTNYVETIKANNSRLEIGLYLSARTFIENEKNVVTSLNGTSSSWFNFSAMNTIMDFYIIEFATFNDCTIDLLHGGITPTESSNPNIMTLDLFETVLKNSTIDTDKLYFEFLISPQPLPGEVGKYKPCEISYNEYCENKNDQKGTWCADTTDILYKKGGFTQRNANGFVGRCIDLVDRDDNCNCGKYSAFDMMVKGFNGETDPKTCEELKP